MKIEAKYQSRVLSIFDQIPAFLSQHEKQVILSDIEAGASFSKFNDTSFFYTHYNVQKHRSDIEIGFLISNKSKTRYKIYPIEVKSTERYSINSLGKFMEKFSERIGQAYVINTKKYRKKDDVVYMPAYMTMCLQGMKTLDPVSWLVIRRDCRISEVIVKTPVLDRDHGRRCQAVGNGMREKDVA